VQWCKSVLDGGLSAQILPQTVLISLLSPDLTALRMWSLTNAFPLGWEIDGFNSEKSEVAIEQIELAYLTMTRTL
jgi:phage tail-like protein